MLRPEPAPLPGPCHHKPMGILGDCYRKGGAPGLCSDAVSTLSVPHLYHVCIVSVPHLCRVCAMSVPAGSSGATWEYYPEIFPKHLIFGVARQGQFSLVGAIPGETACPLAPRGRATPSLCFFPMHLLLPLGELGELAGIPSASTAGRPLVPPGKPHRTPAQPWEGQSQPSSTRQSRGE